MSLENKCLEKWLREKKSIWISCLGHERDEGCNGKLIAFDRNHIFLRQIKAETEEDVFMNCDSLIRRTDIRFIRVVRTVRED